MTMKRALALLLLLCLPTLAVAQPVYVEMELSGDLTTDPMTMTIPADWDAGDLVVAVVNPANRTISSITADWDFHDSVTGVVNCLHIYSKTLEAGDLGATLSVDLNASTTGWITLLRITGHDPDTPINAIEITDDGATVNDHVFPSVTTTVDDCLILHTGFRGSSSVTPGTGAVGSEVYDVSPFYLAQQDKESAGVLGTATYTTSVARRHVNATIAIQPDAAPVLPPTDLPYVQFPDTRPGLILAPAAPL